MKSSLNMDDEGEVCEHKRKLESLLVEPELCDGERYELMQFLHKQHEPFSLNSGDCGETDFVEMDINIENATPIKQPVGLSQTHKG